MNSSQKKQRAKTPTVLQMEAVECGAASLGSILGYHGLHIPLSQLREECGVNRDGSRAANMLKSARQHGLEASGFRRDSTAIFEKTIFPAIIFWRNSHFLVVEGTDDEKVYLNDPASGHRRVTIEEFDRDYSGVALEFTPGPTFKKGGKPYSIFSGLKERLSGERDAMWLIIGLSLLLVLPSLAIPVFSKIFVDKVLVARHINWAIPLLFAMLLTLLIRSSLTWIQQHYILKMQTKLTLTSSSSFLWHVLKLPAKFFSQRYAPEITQRCRLNEMVANLLSTQFTTGALNLFLASFYVLAMLFYDWMLTLFALLIISINGLVLKYAAPLRHDEFMRMAQERGKVDATSMAVLQTMDTIKAQGMEQDVFSFWAGNHASAVQSTQKLGALSNIMGLAPVLLTGITSVIILGAGAVRVMDGFMTLGELVAFQAFAAMLFGPVNQLAALAGSLQDAGASMRRLDDVLKHPAETDTESMMADKETVMLGACNINGSLELKDITFGYSPLNKPLIENFSLKLTPGARVALVGGSGSGKSTLAKIVAGLYKPWSGEVLIDDQPRDDIPQYVLRDSVQMVDQQIFLFSGSVRENLTLWDPTITDESLVKSCKDATIYDVVAGLPGGLDGILQENGTNLSGGQRQCLEIARALVCNPAILILDEATNSLDTVKELQVDFNIRRRGCTCLIVAHRLSTIRDADEIIVLDNGKVVERGTHESLMAMKGQYSQLISTEGT
ncbi:MAG: NHLP family bacteriocin export ABC transporter peptidase/permease/ATPase subunit [Pseudodesulfovibrio sp.]|nr:NHLP family bacteriocin export ABC transporter peptidase/permease/ATPase subunit [Pseudodesulfovibrio sp.]